MAQYKLRRGSVRVRRGSDRVQRGSEGCGVAQIRVRRGSVACCTAVPSLNLGSAPQTRPSTERKAMRTTRVVLYE
jgi:hypothetical protein